MCRSLFGWVMIIFAIVIAILGISLPPAGLRVIIVITNFFDIMLPILAVAALAGYIWKSCCCTKSCG